MKIRFWGTRGSIAKAGPSTIRYGGNTSCVEIRSAANDVVILDGGTGIHGLAQQMLREPAAPRTASIFISHTHWDHIQGLPFFTPFFLPHFKWDIFGPAGVQRNLADVLRGQMSKTYFPITMQAFNAEITHHDLTEGHFQIGDISITTQYLNHPGVTVGYRIVVDDVTVVYSTDHEPHMRRLAAGGIPDKGSEDERHGQFLANADFVIHDAQYTAAEYDKRIGWGHSTMEYVVDLAARADVQHLVLFHHDPNRTDAEIDQIVDLARGRLGDRLGKTEISAAAEGRDLEKQRVKIPRPPPTGSGMPRPMEFAQTIDISVAALQEEVELDDESTVSALEAHKHGVRILLYAPAFPMLEEAVREAGQAVLTAPNVETARELFKQHGPPVVFIEADSVDQFVERWKVISGRSEIEDRTGTPIMKVLVSHYEPPPGAMESAHIQKVLQAPFSLIYAVSRVLIWTNQTTQNWHRAEFPSEDAERVAVVNRVKQVLQNAQSAHEVQQYLEIAQSMLWDAKPQDLMIALNLIDDCFMETAAQSSAEVMIDNVTRVDTSLIPRDLSFCSHVVAQRRPLDVEDVLSSDFRWHPHVIGGARVRSYFGINIDVLGQTVGSLCAHSSHGFKLNEGQRQGLRQIASLLDMRLEQMVLANSSSEIATDS